MNLLPAPRSLKLHAGRFRLPKRATLQLDDALPNRVARLIAGRLQSAASEIGVELALLRSSPRKEAQSSSDIRMSFLTSAATDRKEFYTLTIDRRGVLIEFREAAGLRAAVATLRQLLREYGRRLPRLTIRDWADFACRGVMLDVSRGRVPKVETLLDLADKLADFKINELQLYTEHTFAYRRFKSVWQSWGALTAAEIRKLDARCRELGIDLVPNQNSFGHLRYFLEHPAVKPLAEVSEPYEDGGGAFVRRPSTLAPNHPGTLPFLRGLYEELLPNFSSHCFNVGCDETWDLGRGQSKARCNRLGKGRVYLNFLKEIHRDVSKRGKRMMFWGDIVLHHPKLINELTKCGRADPAARDQDARQRVPTNIVALNWGYEANHPFEREARLFAKSGMSFYVCPGTSTWMTLIGRHDNAFTNLTAAARAGRRHGATGYLITDWGDGGHPQPLAVSWLPYLFGAGTSWCAKSFDKTKLLAVLSRDVFRDPTQRVAQSAMALGMAHRKLGFKATNETPIGTAITAPPTDERELFCRNGLKYHTQIPAKNIRAALADIERQRTALAHARAATNAGRILVRELEFAADMAALSCQFMLWQQSVASGNARPARKLAVEILDRLRCVQRGFKAFWPLRNKGTPKHCSSFLQWRQDELLRWVCQRA